MTSLVAQWLRNSSANAEETRVWSLVSELRFHTPQGNSANVPQLLSPRDRQWEATTMRSPCATTRVAPVHYNEKARTQQWRASAAKNNVFH